MNPLQQADDQQHGLPGTSDGIATATVRRRTVLAGLIAGLWAVVLGRATAQSDATLERTKVDEDLFSFIQHSRGEFDLTAYRQLLGSANEFKEGDAAEGVAAKDSAAREQARRLLGETTIGDLTNHPVFTDDLYHYIQQAVDGPTFQRIANWRMNQLVRFLLSEPEEAIQSILPGLPSDIIACAVKLMSNEQLIAVGRKVFNPLPGSNIGAKGYLGARIQPNSPTDHPEDIQWQVFNGWAYAVGDVVLGNNPVSSEVSSVAVIEQALKEILQAFGLEQVLPHCVLSHIDVQAEVEKQFPGSTALWFQSLAGVDDANQTFDLTLEKMRKHAASRDGQYGLYFETGQGADATNGHGKGFDIVMHESRKYGFARALKKEVAEAQRRAGKPVAPWVHLNDVAGFIGPEIFRTREQLVRCCLEDTVMGKLHGLTIGLDICSTLHMEVNLDDLDWCMDQIMPANPAYLMALPTKNDPMLSYLTTAFQDHVRMREKFGFKVDDRMWSFFQELKIIDDRGEPTEHFGQPNWVYLQYRRRLGDTRSDEAILAEGRQCMENVRSRGVFLAEGFGSHRGKLEPGLEQRVRYLYEDAKQSIWTELPADFASTLPAAVTTGTLSKDRLDYILHPPTGEVLSTSSQREVQRLRERHQGAYNVQIVLSDGLNSLSLTDEGHLMPFLESVRTELTAAGFKPAPEPIVVRSGRVRAGYRIGELLYGGLPESDSMRAVLHVIGERPGSGHHAFSVYITSPPVSTWTQPGTTDHNITKVVSGIADTALTPDKAARDTVRILKRMISA